ncbi:MAG TPA: Gfo/Idh/MocA family oxidoreductase [Patescibacteria group bacterium]|nr:Gfo/Idh/MocA family oxidoreductase [Patescibacteria group bacterium]
MKDKLRVGIIGAGAVVREIYQHLFFKSDYSDRLEICSVADPNEQYRNWFGDLAGLPAQRRFDSYEKMFGSVELDAAQVNTPDHLHCAPTIAALQAGLDVIVPKPTASTIKDAHQMIEEATRARRFLGIDFHKREDPRIREAQARFQSGRYGQFQAAVFYMLDKLLVADPNHSPRFFASAGFAEKNTPISFLTVHMADALMQIINLIPVKVRATGHAHKLPALKPVSVKGYDLVDTEIIFENGGTAHILTGWALPNSAWSTTVQSARLIFSDGLIDLGLDTPGLREIHPEGILEINPLFRNFGKDETVSGYGITSPGRLYEAALARRNGSLSAAELEKSLSPMALGFYATLVLEGAEKSLASGERIGHGTTSGSVVDLKQFAAEELGKQIAAQYGLG